MKKALLVIIAFVLPIGVFAEPSISSVSGNILNGESVTISGTGFGTKTQATPIKWDNFESGNIGQAVGNGWFVQGLVPRYANDVLRTGSSKSAKQDFTTNSNYNSTLGFTGLNNSKLYVSFWKYSLFGGSGLSRNWKIMSFRGGAPGDWTYPNGRHDVYPLNGSGHIYFDDCAGGGTYSNWFDQNQEMAQGQWQRFEYWVDQGDPNVANSEYEYSLDGVLRAYIRDRVARTSNCTFTNAYINSYFATDTNGALSYHWLDDVYIDSTQSRVELGSSPTWTVSSSNHREIQPTSSWSADSITFSMNQGSFSSNDTAYLYIIDSDGNANANGYAVTIGGSSTPPEPPPPPKTGDLNSDNVVDILDYNLLVSNFGRTGSGIVGDIDANSKVDIFDYNLLVGNYGK